MADSVIIRIDGDEREYELSLKNVEKQTERTEKKVKSSMDTSAKVVSGLNKTVKGLALGFGAVGTAVIGMGVNYNAQIEQYTAGFTTMLGSAEKANETLENLRGFAEKTPFELTDLANASTTLLAFGEDVESLMPDLKILGDISLGNSEKFKSLALVFGQVQSQGKLMGQDLLQMINSGFNPLQVISEKTGESMSSLKDKMSKGQISFEMVAEAMRMATSEGGQFYNAMEAQSKTFQGQMSTLKDNVTSLTGDIASDISEKLTDDVLPMLIEKVEQLKQAWADGSLQSAIGTATSGMVAFGVAVGGLNLVMIANDIIQLKKGVEGYTTATKLGAAAQKMMNAELLKNPYTLAATALAALIAGIITYAATHKSTADEIAKSHKEAIKAIDENIQADMSQAETAIVLKDRLFELEKQINSGKLTDYEASAAKKEFNNIANQLNEIIPGIIDNIGNENNAYDIQNEKVETLTQSFYKLAYAKAMANAYQEKIDQTAKDLVEVKEELKLYEDGTKSKTRTGIAAFFWGTNDPEYWKLRDQQKELENEMQSYVNEVQSYQQEISKNTTETIEEETNEQTQIITDATDKQTKTKKEQQDKELKDLQFAHKMKMISDKEYYDALERYRDKYFDKGSEEWQKYTQEIYEYNKSVIEDAESKLEEFYKKQTDIAEKLNGENKTFTKFKIVDGDETKEYTMLADSSKDIQQLSRYNVLLDQLFEKRSELPDEIYGYLSEMGTEEAISYIEAMLNASDEEFNKYISGLEEKQKQAEKISEKLTKNEIEDFKNALEEEFGQEVPEDFFDIGDESAKKFGEGFLEQLKGILQNIRQQIIESMSITPLAAYGGVGGISGNISNSYTNTYTFNSSKDTTTQQLFAAQKASTISQLQGGS